MPLQFGLSMESANGVVHEGNHAFALGVFENSLDQGHGTSLDAKGIDHDERRSELLILLIDVVENRVHMVVERAWEDMGCCVGYRWLPGQELLQMLRSFFLQPQ